MTARNRNTRSRHVVALLAVLLLGVGLASCGGAQQSAQSLVRDTFGSRQQISSGKIDLSLNLSAKGLKSLSDPVAVHVAGPFQSFGPTQFPRFDLTVGLTAAGHTLQAGAISTASQFFLKLGGLAFLAPSTTRKTLQQSYAQASKSAASQKSVSTFAALGIDPASWLKDPVNAGTAQIGGAKTIHISAGLDLKRFLLDAAKLSGAGSQLGLANSELSGLLSPSEAQALSKSVSSAHVDLYTGAHDHLLRWLSVKLALQSNATTRPELQGLRSANLELQMKFEDLNESQTITAPKSPRPMSQLVAALREIGLLGSSGEAATTAGGQESNSQGLEQSINSASAPDAYARCVKAAGQNVSALQKCVSLLGS